MTTLIQFSDLHLSGKVGEDDSYQAFLACLVASLSYRPDGFILTGDLVNCGKADGYDWLFDKLSSTNIPFYAIAGNHDVTLEHNAHLPFEERSFMPITADTRLLDCTRLSIDNWQLLLLNSAVCGHIHGQLSLCQLDWLNETLSCHNQPALLALHHPPLAVGSAWIDNYQLQDSHKLWQIISQHRHLRLILCGHVHQNHTIHYHHTTIHTSIGTHYQFMPYADDFCLDTKKGGFVVIRLNQECCQLFTHRLT